jgi:hypothetical protein
LGRTLPRVVIGHRLVRGRAACPSSSIGCSDGRKEALDNRRACRAIRYRIDGRGLGWQVATYKGHQVIRHAGGYARTSALIAFVPDKQIGVAVVMNAGGPVQPLTEIVALDVFNRLLGIEGADKLPWLMAQSKKPRPAAGGGADEPLPVSAKNLSLPPAAYVGIYANEHRGTLRIENKDGNLALTIGELPVPVKSTAADAFQLRTEQVWRDSRFVLEDKRVAAVVVRWENCPA